MNGIKDVTGQVLTLKDACTLQMPTAYFLNYSGNALTKEYSQQ